MRRITILINEVINAIKYSNYIGHTLNAEIRERLPDLWLPQHKSNSTAVAVQMRQISRDSLVTICKFDLEKHRSKSQNMTFTWAPIRWRISKFIKVVFDIFFCASSHCFWDINNWNIWPWNSRLRSRSVLRNNHRSGANPWQIWKCLKVVFRIFD